MKFLFRFVSKQIHFQRLWRLIPVVCSLLLISLAGCGEQIGGGAFNKSQLKAYAELSAAVSHFKTTAQENWADAVLMLATDEGMQKLHDIDTSIWEVEDAQIGWTLFFNSAIPVIAPSSGDHAIAGFYNPFSDVFLIGSWEKTQEVYQLSDVELVAGDWLRQSEDELDILPLWKRGEGSVPVLLAREVSASVSAFESAFAEYDGIGWRSLLPVLEDAAVLNAINKPLVMVLVNLHLQNVLKLSYTPDPDDAFSGLGDGIAHIIDVIASGSLESVFNVAEETDELTKERLRALPGNWVAEFRVSVAVSDGKSSLVFLSPREHSSVCLVMKFDMKGKQPILERLEFIDFQYFYEQEKSASIKEDPS